MKFLMCAIFLAPLQSRVAQPVVSQYNLLGTGGLAIQRGKPMEALLVLAGLAGVAALLLPGQPLPSETDYTKAQAKLKETPEDPDANTVVGKYLAFVLGNYDEAMPYLSKSTDKTLKTLADHERAPLYTDNAPKKIGMGDEWVAAAKEFKALNRIFYDRASQWYALAWPDLDPVWKEKTRIQGMKLAAARPPGGARKGLPTGWNADQTIAGMKPPVLDGTISHTGSYSIKMMPSDEKVQNTFSQLKSDVLVIPPGKQIEYSAMVMSNGTENANDRLVFYFVDKNSGSVFIPLDMPLWNRVGGKMAIPDGATRAMIGVIQSSKKGNIWVDDISVKVDGKELLKNSSFE